MFTRMVQEYSKYSPLDKVCSRLTLKAKMHFCPELSEFNFVDGPVSKDTFDFT